MISRIILFINRTIVFVLIGYGCTVLSMEDQPHGLTRGSSRGNGPSHTSAILREHAQAVGQFEASRPEHRQFHTQLDWRMSTLEAWRAQRERSLEQIQERLDTVSSELRQQLGELQQTVRQHGTGSQDLQAQNYDQRIGTLETSMAEHRRKTARRSCCQTFITFLVPVLTVGGWLAYNWLQDYGKYSGPRPS